MTSDECTHGTERVWIVVYNAKWPEGGYEIGGVYSSEEEANQAAEEQRCADREWFNSYVLEREVQAENDQSEEGKNNV